MLRSGSRIAFLAAGGCLITTMNDTARKLVSRDNDFVPSGTGSADEQGEICVKSPQCFTGYLGTDSACVS